MKRLILLFLTVFMSLNVSGQGKKKDQEVEIINHEVQLGESVRMISKKYLVDPAEIYKLNKFAVEGISQGMILKIPVPKKDESVQDQADQGNPAVIERTSDLHTVVPKETLNIIAKKYGVTVDGIQALNPEIENGVIKVGEIIKIPPQSFAANNSNVAETPAQTTASIEPKKPSPEKPSSEETAQANPNQSPEVITHVVAPKETLYSLSKKYNVTIDEIKQQNQALMTKGLQIGQTLTIKKN